MSATDQTLAELASTHHGIVTDARASARGISAKTLSQQVRRHRAVRMQRGVYLIGAGPLSERSRWMAATEGAGTGAALTLWAGARLWGISPWPAHEIDVIVAHRRRHRVGVRVHQSRSLLPEEITVVDRIPVLRVERLLVELADVCSVGRLCRLIDQATYRELVDFNRLRSVMARHRNRRGHGRLELALSMYEDGSTGTRSRFEEATMGRVIHVPGTRRLECTRVDIAGLSLEPDIYLPELSLMIEIDDPSHDKPTKRRSDRSNDLRLAGAGITVVRIHWDDLEAGVRRANFEIVARCRAAGIVVPARLARQVAGATADRRTK